MQALDFPNGYYYLIICKGTQQALKMAENNPSKYEKSRITGAKPNPTDNGQLWMIQRLKVQTQDYQFVNCLSALLFDQQSKQIRLRRGKQSSDQLFCIVKAPTKGPYPYYWIKTSQKGDKAVSLQGNLKYGKFNPNSDNQLFRFEVVGKNNYTIQNSALIVNNLSGKVIDVPGASFKHGERIIMWTKNKRWNQRWYFQKQSRGYMIKSVLTNHVLDIAEEKRENGSKIVQWDQTGKTNQRWMPEECGNGLYKFRSAHETSMFLAVQHQNKDDGGHLQICCDQNSSMYWRVQGQLP